MFRSLYPSCRQIYLLIRSGEWWKARKTRNAPHLKGKKWQWWTESTKRENGRLKQRWIGWWINMERGNTSLSDSWWKEAQNMLKLNRHKHITQLSLDYISSCSASAGTAVFSDNLSVSLCVLHLHFCFKKNYFNIISLLRKEKATGSNLRQSTVEENVLILTWFEVDAYNLWWMESVFFFFYLCERKSSNFLHDEHQLSLSCWAVTYDRERSACSGSQNHSGFVPLSIKQIIWCYAHLCACKVRVKIPHSDPGA